MKTQVEMILDYLKSGKGITQLEATRLFGITRLSAAIYIIRKQGYAVDKQREHAKNRYGRKVSYDRYKLADR